MPLVALPGDGLRCSVSHVQGRRGTSPYALCRLTTPGARNGGTSDGVCGNNQPFRMDEQHRSSLQWVWSETVRPRG